MASRAWLIGTLVLTFASFALAIGLAPSGEASPTGALVWLLFLASSVHVASTAWFATVPEVRQHARAHLGRYAVAPAILVVGTAVVAAWLTPAQFRWLLLGFFAWQFAHFQKQNLGMAALAAVRRGVPSLLPLERHALVVAGWFGIGGLLLHPHLLQLHLDTHLGWLFPIAGAGYGVAVLVGAIALRRRTPDLRPATYTLVYLTGLAFFAPVFVFDSPYAAVAGLTLAHGYQYLLIMGLVAGASVSGRSSVISLAVLFNVAIFGGLALNGASHLHDGSAGARALYGAALGLVMAHFVIDAGLWRLRDEFPRTFLRERLPYLLVAPVGGKV